ncbi:MAG: sigma-70 family RNA polymerase sigma factor [Caldilineaceae bacterium]|nr:sigma-70 family RNA polymerase sigma factor [Caldilineaceae bacterium]
MIQAIANTGYDGAISTMEWSSTSRSAAGTAALDISAAIHAARLGDEVAFSQLVDHYFATAQRVAEHILRTEEAASDAVQEALIKVHRALPRFKDGNFRSWLLRIVTNTCYDHLRSQKRRLALSLEEMTERPTVELPIDSSAEGRNPEAVSIQNESMELLLRTIDDLPVWHRSVVLLVDVHGYDYAEAAELLDLPLGTVKSRLSRARAALRTSLLQAGLVPKHLADYQQ